MNEFVIHELVIENVTLTPNPANTSARMTIAAKVTERTRVLEPVYPFSGQANIYSGSVYYANINQN